MAKTVQKKEFDKRFSGTINSVKDKEKSPTTSLRGRIYLDDVDNPLTFTGIQDGTKEKPHISFSLASNDSSDVFATQNHLADGELKFNQYRNSDAAPDWRTGDAVKINGKQYRFSCWTRDGGKSGKFLSVAVQSEDDYQQRIASAKGEATAKASVTPEEAGI